MSWRLLSTAAAINATCSRSLLRIPSLYNGLNCYFRHYSTKALYSFNSYPLVATLPSKSYMSSTASASTSATATIAATTAAASLKINNLIGSTLNNHSAISTKVVGIWLGSVAGMVMGAIILGGATRLTESGLSMTSWHLIKGMKAPSSIDEWEAEFERYQSYPEFQQLKRDMTLNEFKSIFYMEYLHRMWGRAIGVVFALPVVFFSYKGWLRELKLNRVAGALGVMIAGQGLLGWYMVKSGLEHERFTNTNDVPRVSQYRLAAHLSSALVIYVVALWSSLRLLVPAKPLEGIAGVSRLRKFAHSTAGFVFLTAVSGAFVAGLDAGLVYNSWPMMADRWIPTDIFAHTPLICNFFENPTTVQFDHRFLGHTTFAVAVSTWLVGRNMALPRSPRLALNAVLSVAVLQVGLGISTLLSYVPVPLALMHQSGSVMLLTAALSLLHYIRKVPK